jgi:sugar lactone lactonase YvrE
VFTPGGTITTVAGTGGCCFAGDGGPATAALQLTPGSVAVDSAGDIYFSSLVRTADGTGLSPVVREVTPDGIINTVAGNGTLAPGFGGDGGPASLASFGTGIAVAIDASGNLLIADTYNNRVRRVDSNGVITTLAGNGRNVVSGDGGSATAAGVPSPFGMVADSLGNIYIGSYQGSIRKVGPDGTISTYAGGRYGFSGDGGPAISAALAGPHGLALDAAGNLYIADYANNRVRVVSPQ